ncbi:hypothetical protein QC764_401337 [Podospora pseudoanserina]|uniref:Uncharacterized protein n=1 Tax=Podospora pseudoanserina TaxID=2609844 RepID=A0ABR0I8P2_9PEZI|nr:hypothetical protein QC764_401337 [Podospora pseudoanserina]
MSCLYSKPCRRKCVNRKSQARESARQQQFARWFRQRVRQRELSSSLHNRIVALQSRKKVDGSQGPCSQHLFSGLEDWQLVSKFMSHNNTKQLLTDVPNSPAALSTQLLWSKVIALSLSPGPLNNPPSQPLFKQLDPFESPPSFIPIPRHHQLNTHNKLHPFRSYKQIHNPQKQTKMDSHFTNPTISSKNKEKGKQPAKASSSFSSSFSSSHHHQNTCPTHDNSHKTPNFSPVHHTASSSSTIHAISSKKEKKNKKNSLSTKMGLWIMGTSLEKVERVKERKRERERGREREREREGK